MSVQHAVFVNHGAISVFPQTFVTARHPEFCLYILFLLVNNGLLAFNTCFIFTFSFSYSFSLCLLRVCLALWPWLGTNSSLPGELGSTQPQARTPGPGFPPCTPRGRADNAASSLRGARMTSMTSPKSLTGHKPALVSELGELPKGMKIRSLGVTGNHLQSHKSTQSSCK